MTKIKSGLILVAVGVGLNIFGRLIERFHPPVPSLIVVAAVMALFGLASVVLVLFGLFRIIVGFIIKNKRTSASPVVVADDTVWPPAPKPPDNL